MPAPTSTKVIAAQSALNTAGVDDYTEVARTHTMTVVASAGSSAGVVALELSQDGTNWVAESGNTVTVTTPGVQSVTIVDKVYTMARARISTAITGGTVDVWIARAP